MTSTLYKKALFSLVTTSFLTLLPSSLSANDDPLLRDNIIMIFDDSGSMRGRLRDNLFNTKLNSAKKAAKEFITHLPANYNVGFYALNAGYVFPLQKLQPASRKKLLNQISQFSANGGTPITKSVQLMSVELNKQKEMQAGYGTYTLVIATDGEANEPKSMLKAVDEAIENEVQIKTIGINIDRHALRSVTNFAEASSTKELIIAMKRAIHAEINPMSHFVAQDF